MKQTYYTRYEMLVKPAEDNLIVELLVILTSRSHLEMGSSAEYPFPTIPYGVLKGFLVACTRCNMLQISSAQLEQESSIKKKNMILHMPLPVCSLVLPEIAFRPSIRYCFLCILTFRLHASTADWETHMLQ